MRYCICADPENCKETIPGYVCRKAAAPSLPAMEAAIKLWRYRSNFAAQQQKNGELNRKERAILQGECQAYALCADELESAIAAIASPPHPSTPQLSSISARLEMIIEEMRSEKPRYKSHDLGFVDSVSAHRVDDWADELQDIQRKLVVIASPPHREETKTKS